MVSRSERAPCRWCSASSAGFAGAIPFFGGGSEGAVEAPFDCKRISSHVTALVFPILEED